MASIPSPSSRWDFRPELCIFVGGFEEVQEFLANEVGQSLLRSEVVFDASGCFALLDPDFVKFQHKFSPVHRPIPPFCEHYREPRGVWLLAIPIGAGQACSSGNHRIPA